MGDHDLRFICYERLEGTSGAGICRLVGTDDPHVDVTSLADTPEYHSRVEAALREYKADFKGRGSDRLERHLITTRYIEDTVIWI